MTYEDLIVALANELPSISGSAMRLLIRLIACCIENGTSDISVSKYWLAEKTGLSREGVTLACRELERLIQIKLAAGVNTRFILPEEWFTPQRSLFALDARVQNRHNQPTFLASSSQETRLPPANFPGGTSQLSRRHQPGNLATVANSVGELARKPGDTSQETWLDATRNQQLTGAPDSIDWIKGLSSREDLVDALDRLVRVDRVGKQQQEDAEILRGRLVVYRQEFGQHELARIAPDDKIVARCLRIASIAELCATLNQMAAERIVPKPKNAWFVTLLLNKIHGVPPELTAERIRLRYERKPPSSIQNPKFGRDLVASAQLSMGVVR